jgi:hypothetical protein
MSDDQLVPPDDATPVAKPYVYMYHADTWYHAFGYAEFKFS